MPVQEVIEPARPSADAGEERHAQLESTISDLIQVIHRLARLASHVSGNTESPATWRTLSVLLAYGPLRLGALADRSRVSQPTMTKIVRGLVEREWVKRIADTDDARAWQIAITRKGSRALDGWRTTIGSALSPLFEGISEHELSTLQEGVRIIKERELLAADTADALLGHTEASARDHDSQAMHGGDRR